MNTRNQNISLVKLEKEETIKETQSLKPKIIKKIIKAIIDEVKKSNLLQWRNSKLEDRHWREKKKENIIWGLFGSNDIK